MSDKQLQALYGLKWNPFLPEVPAEALWVPPALQSFVLRVEPIAREGGFVLLGGEPGTGKSCDLRIVADHLERIPDLRVAVLTRPQSRLHDFYREIGELFGLTLSPHNRWSSTKALRERWHAHIEHSLLRPVLLIDEAQEMPPSVLNELRLLSSTQLDSRILLCCVLAGDGRLSEKLRAPDLLPLGSRIRARLVLHSASPAELRELLLHALAAAGNPQLLSPALIDTLTTHAAGNPRVLMNLGADLLAVATTRQLPQLDEKLYLETFGNPVMDTVRPRPNSGASAQARRR